jgi:hypothetical protein
MSFFPYSPSDVLRLSAKLPPQEAPLLRLLPFYIEHMLVSKPSEAAVAWEPDNTDSTWQAICWYYGLALKCSLSGPSNAGIDLVSNALKIGAFMNSFNHYPFWWDAQEILDIRNPTMAGLNLLDYIENPHELSPTKSRAAIPLTGFHSHINKVQRGKSLQLSKGKSHGGQKVVILNDGQFRTAAAFFPTTAVTRQGGEQIQLDIPTGPVRFNHPMLDSAGVRQEIWRRWWLAWELSQPLDVVTEDGTRWDGVTVIAALVSDYLKTFEEVNAILTAISTWTNKAPVKDSVIKFIVSLRQECAT